jgi:thiol:disulfide interchange protein
MMMLFFGNVLILKKEFEISILIPDIVNNTQDNITVNYRGCAEAGFCYPMETLSFRISDKIL